MKKIYILSSLLAMLFAVWACEDNEWPQPAVELTPVYSLSDIQWGDNSVDKPFGIDWDGSMPAAYDVYQNKPLMIEFKVASKDLAKNREITNYQDNSANDSIIISFEVQYSLETETNPDSLYSKIFEVFADSSGTGRLYISEDYYLGQVITATFDFPVQVMADEVYN